ncbi:MAG: dockerin type I repeat-containing protein, partial [Muribaculaceae bacterium]|nr:dockerin type I repeat-containing protein [Muribaculaceae bacterium]
SLVLRNCKVTKPEGGYSDGEEIVAPGSTSMWWGELEIVATGSQGVPGDVDGDGHVSSVDVTALYNYLLNNDDSAIVNGDQDGDGHISSVDVTFVYNILLGN